MLKRILCACMAALMLLGAPSVAFAKQNKSTGQTEPVEEETQRVIHLEKREELLALAEDCRLDTYSQDLKVVLKCSIDMAGCDFTGIPYFNGTFEGRGFTISGLKITADGSYQGFFRYLGEDAVVHKLKLEGEIAPNGSRTAVGGFAGENAGRISGCSFTGTVTGGDMVGGIAGSNTLTGIVEDCKVAGTIGGNHMLGGIAGDNTGVIRRCENRGDINSTSQQNQIKLSDLSLDNLTKTEMAASATDIGGIAGASSGVITDCTNRGAVGYQQMGFNVGGIAGRQTGTVLKCKNYADIRGRKEVGGIVGHLEPAAEIEYDEDALQILERQLDGLQSSVSQASARVSGTAAELSGELTEMSWYIEDAWEAASLLVPDPDGSGFPDEDTLVAAGNALSDSLSNMTYAMQDLGTVAYSSMGALSGSMSAIQNQLGAMGATLNNASNALGGKVEDVSDEDGENDLSGKVADCENHGSVQADANLGGIVGAIALQSELDASEAVVFTGQDSLNFVSKVRAVVRSCENRGQVTSGKQNLGGIAGYQTLGLIRECTNTASVGAENAQYVGGITGNSTGYVRMNSAKCHLQGSACVGGISGSGTVATDCRSMVEILDGKEKLGAILGVLGENLQEVEDPVEDNLYTYHGRDPGGIDGISYSGKAEGMQQSSFLQREDTPDLFREVTVSFRFADGSTKDFTLKPGTGLRQSQIPEIPQIPGFEGYWDGLKDVDITHVDFDLFFDLVYESDNPTIASQENRNGLPVLLVQGNFAENGAVKLTAAQQLPAMGEDWTAAEGWDIVLEGTKAVAGARYLAPENPGKNAVLMVRLADGSWAKRDFTVNGSYLVFSMDGTETGIALFAQEEPAWYRYAMGAAIGALTVIVITLWKKKKK